MMVQWSQNALRCASILVVTAFILAELSISRRFSAKPSTLASTLHATSPPKASTESHTRQVRQGVLTKTIYTAGYIRPHPELCPSLGAKVRLVILIASPPKHSTARRTIRITWGHAAQRSDIVVAFLLGISPHMEEALEREDALYGDLIQAKFVDSYYNLSLKSVSMLEWKDTFCPRAPRLLKTDDDIFVNVARLLQFAEAPVRCNATATVWGKLVRHSRPKRYQHHKYYAPLEEFSDDVYPDFITGGAYLVTGDAAGRLARAAIASPYLRLEDVFVTGVVASSVGVRRENARRFVRYRAARAPCRAVRWVAVHMVGYRQQMELWRCYGNVAMP